MTEDDKALVERLRSIYRVKLPNYIDDAADRIEAQAAEIERTGQRILMWLGAYRDGLSEDAITDLQSIARAALGEME